MKYFWNTFDAKGGLSNFSVNSWVFNDDKFESEAKINSGPRVCPLLVVGLHFVCVEHAQCPLLAHQLGRVTMSYARLSEVREGVENKQREVLSGRALGA